MKITNLLTIQGRNEWGPPPVLEARFELDESTAVPGSSGWISPRIAALLDTTRTDFASEGSDPKTLVARVVGQLAMTFQRLSGSNGTFVAARAIDDNTTLVALDFQNESLARASLEAALKLYEATRDDQPFPFAETLKELRVLANDNKTTKGVAAIFPSAPRKVERALPYASSA